MGWAWAGIGRGASGRRPRSLSARTGDAPRRRELTSTKHGATATPWHGTRPPCSYELVTNLNKERHYEARTKSLPIVYILPGLKRLASDDHDNSGDPKLGEPSGRRKT